MRRWCMCMAALGLLSVGLSTSAMAQDGSTNMGSTAPQRLADAISRGETTSTTSAVSHAARRSLSAAFSRSLVSTAIHTAQVENERLAALHSPRAQRFEGARQAIVTGDTTAARVHLKALDPPTKPEHDRFWTMHALILLKEGKGNAALAALQKVDAERTKALPYIVWLEARAAKMAGKYEHAEKLYAGLVDTKNHRLLPYWRVEYADLLLSERNYPAARKAYAKILEYYPEFPQRHVATFRLGQCQLAMGDKRQAGRTFFRVYKSWPWKEEGEKARQILLAQYEGRERPQMGRGEELEWASSLRRQKHWYTAREALNRLMLTITTERGNSKMENEIRMQLALIEYERQDYETAIPALNALNARFDKRGQSNGLGRDFVRMLLQRAHHRNGDSATALAILEKRIQGRPSKAKDRELGKFYHAAGDYLKAFKHLDRSYGKGERQGFDYAYLLYKAQRYSRAGRNLNQLRRFARGELGAKYDYWYARAIAGDGKVDKAKEILKEVATDHPLSYYGLQAQNRLTEWAAAAHSPKTSQPVAVLEGIQATFYYEEPDHTPEDGPYSPLPPLAFNTANTAEVSASPAPTVMDRRARIYWSGPTSPPDKGSRNGNPAPQFGMRAYINGQENLGAIRLLASLHGELWESVEAAAFLHEIGMHFDAQQEMRNLALEYRGLRGAGRPAEGRPIRLGYKKNAHYIDHRGSARRGFWGMGAGDLRFPVSSRPMTRRAHADRQQAIYDGRSSLDLQVVRAMKEVGEYHLVRRCALNAEVLSGANCQRTLLKHGVKPTHVHSHSLSRNTQHRKVLTLTCSGH